MWSTVRGHRNPNTLDSPPQFAKYHVNSGVFDFENVVWECRGSCTFMFVRATRQLLSQ